MNADSMSKLREKVPYCLVAFYFFLLLK